MAQPESDDLSQLMPTLREQARLEASPGNTVALREYIKVLGERTVNVPATSAAQPGAKPRTDGLVPRAGSGRRPQRRFFTIKWSADAPTAEDQAAAEAAEAEDLDPEALKDALVEQARVQRSALVQAGQRVGTGRVPRRREFAITLLPPQMEEEVVEEAAEEATAAEQAAAAAEEAAIAAEEEAAAALEAEAFAAGQLQQAQLDAQQPDEWGAEVAPQQYWEGFVTEEGVLAEHAGVVALQPADACTPGAALHQQQQQLEGLERGGSSEAEVAGATVEQQQQEQQEPGTSQRAQARTPGTSLYGRYTPMEGVPERLVLLATRGKGALGMGQVAHLGAATAPRSARPAGTPAGFTPLEGIPERLRAFQVLPGATRVCSNAAGRPASVDSPVEGLVLEGAARRRAVSGGALLPAQAAAAAAPAEAGTRAGFGGFAPPPAPSPGALPAPAMLLEQQAGQEVAAVAAPADVHAEGADVDEMGGGGFDDDGLHEGEPAPHSAAAGRCMSGFPLRADAAVQTGTSLAAEEAEGAAAAGGSPGAGAATHAAAEEQEELVENGAYDDYDAGDMYDDQCDMYHQDGDEDEAEDVPEASAAAERRAQRQTRNPGARLRNELKRKSLAADPGIGRHEVLPGVRRSSRQREQPLKWWLNEKKEFGRSHKTMPTVNNVVHTVPNTPWRTVTDIKRRPAKKKRAPTPADLERALAGAEDEEEQQHGQVQQQHEEGEDEHAPQAEEELEQQQQRRRAGSGGRQQAQQRRGAAGRRQAQGAAAKQPPAARGAATKKKGVAAGKKRKARQ